MSTFLSTALSIHNKNSKKSALLATLVSGALLSTGCQSIPSSQADATTTPTLQAQKLESFTINGKIGVTTPTGPSASSADGSNASKQGGSAFYTWGQEDNRFAIELMGALGIGKTNIEYDGQTATLVSEKTGSLSAEDPEALLQKATGWQAPISQMPYWISGRSAPSDTAPQVDSQNRLISSVNGNWSAKFAYDGDNKLPNKIIATQPQGQKVVMTINHLSQ
ncbi:MAG: lipoprotein insertase outer membrane protein LolB [Psychrobacter sp.]|jgi:outer membrane lipoprotein LolB|uniref:lipoprotein insertase outer membrane protein LolB n=1 Tax=Psychrobacter submarinus TaxID=154108 RepID=UPI003C5A1A45